MSPRPDFAHVLEECFERLVERAVVVGYESYAFQCYFVFSLYYFGKLHRSLCFIRIPACPTYTARQQVRRADDSSSWKAGALRKKRSPSRPFAATPATAGGRGWQWCKYLFRAAAAGGPPAPKDPDAYSFFPRSRTRGSHWPARSTAKHAVPGKRWSYTVDTCC